MTGVGWSFGAEQGTGRETWPLALPLANMLCGLDKGLPSPCLGFLLVRTAADTQWSRGFQSPGKDVQGVDGRPSCVSGRRGGCGELTESGRGGVQGAGQAEEGGVTFR